MIIIITIIVGLIIIFYQWKQLADQNLWKYNFTKAAALRACLTSSFAPFGRSGRVTHASVQWWNSALEIVFIFNFEKKKI